MKNSVMTTEQKDLRFELKKAVENWVNTFNHFNVSVLEKYTDGELFESILPLPIDVEEWFNNQSENEQEDLFSEYLEYSDFEEDEKPAHFSFGIPDDFIVWLTEEKESDIQQWEDRNGRENYPMWNTLFEFKDNAWNDTETIEKIQALGLGVIQHDDFNTIIFMMSAGHSFYSSYWIPLYLALFPSEAENFKGVDYSGL